MCDDRTVRAFLRRLGEAVRRNTLQVETDAQQEAEEQGVGATDIANILTSLTLGDFLKRPASTRYPGRYVWVFTPEVDDELTLWIRMVELPGIVVFSFHDRDED